MMQITCWLTAQNQDQLRNPMLGNQVWAIFTLSLPSSSSSSIKLERITIQTTKNGRRDTIMFAASGTMPIKTKWRDMPSRNSASHWNIHRVSEKKFTHPPVKGKGSPYSITECRVPEVIPVLGSQPAGNVSHKPGGKLPLLSTRPAVTLATPKRAATNFAAWWTDARWVWTVCLRLSVVAVIWTQALLHLSPAC